MGAAHLMLNTEYRLSLLLRGDTRSLQKLGHYSSCTSLRGYGEWVCFHTVRVWDSVVGTFGVSVALRPWGVVVPSSVLQVVPLGCSMVNGPLSVMLWVVV